VEKLHAEVADLLRRIGAQIDRPTVQPSWRTAVAAELFKTQELLWKDR
jgi:hypothetical protein